MAEFNLERFKYRWRGEWSSGTFYRRDDIVRVKGKSYVCVVSHTGSNTFRQDLTAILPDSNPPQPQPKWIVMTDGRSFVGEWGSSNVYDLGDIILFDGSLWECVISHSSTTFQDNIDNWTLFAEHIKYKGAWEASSNYGIGALVKYNGIAYKCINPHTSGDTLELNAADWEVFHDGIEYVGNWQTGFNYRKNDYVKYGGSIFKVLTTHLSGLDFESGNFRLEIPGTQFDGEWSVDTPYQIGDIVRYGGYLWFATSNNTAVDPYDAPSFWIQISFSYNFRGDWAVGATYYPGDVVQRGGNLWVAKIQIGGGDTDGSSVDYLDSDVWDILNPGFRWKGFWTDGVEYALNDIVYYLGTAYKCNFQHVSNNTNWPGDNGDETAYWDLFIQAGQPGGLSQRGDLLTFDLSRSLADDGSTIGDTRVPIGSRGQLLSIDNEDSIYYRDFLSDSDVIFVAPNGIDITDDGYGLSQYKPFKTIRFALQYAEDNYTALTPLKVRISTGRYEEVCPMTVPAGCVVMGDELRSTTIVAAPANPAYAFDTDYTYHTEVVNYSRTIISDLMNSVPITPLPGNTVAQKLETQVQAETPVQVDDPTFIFNPDVAVGDVPPDLFVGLLDTYQQKLNFNLESGDTDPAIVGTNSRTEDANVLRAANVLKANRQFLINQTIAYIRQQYPDLTWDDEKLEKDLYEIIRGIEYDLEYTGTYKTILAARSYINKSIGSAQEDMFYFRDTTGIRQCTLDGLGGNLNPPGVFDLYQRPTGGAYCSLDPGWGPDDTRTWIINRSPYLQGVTNLGTACVGKKVDGSLHNGGNRSMTSNDFTQVISDGIGAWVLNNGRAELVSVFTYYAAIGYLAEDGGIIRATNGNNSYGKFGSIADGLDATEIPATGKVFNRQSQALIESAFAGDFSDQIFTFEYSHCGEDYTSASADIEGAGVNGIVEYDEFRDHAIKQVRLLGLDGSGATGGAGYTTARGNAQAGDTTTITISATDNSDPEDYLGLRIVIVSGDGTGQYAYIKTYNEVTKLIEVYKESDDTPGWDHIVPGTPIESTLSTNAQYQIEPRIQIDAPPFQTNGYNYAINRRIKSVVQGDTSGSYSEVAGTAGTGSTDESVSAAVATFDVERTGTQYVVTLADGGAGYVVDDVLTIAGTNFEGTSPANDITITVTATTDDSTNSITGFTSTGTGVGGKIVALATPNYIQISDSGELWTETNINRSADWKKIVSGNGRFIALAQNDPVLGYSIDGTTWVSRTLPESLNWTDIIYGGGYFVAIAENSNTVAYSEDGLTWLTSTIPDDNVGDSTASQWQKVAYGQGKWLIISSNDETIAISTNLTSWTRKYTVTNSDTLSWIGFEYGDNRFIAVASTGEVRYTLDTGDTWYEGTTVTSPDGSTVYDWKGMTYGQGTWLVFGDTGSKIIGADPTSGPTDYVVSTNDGLKWEDRTLSVEGSWIAGMFASLNNEPTFILMQDDNAVNGVNRIQLGKKAFLRSNVQTGGFANVKIIDPGSGYNTEFLLPTVTITDNLFTTEVELELKFGDGVLPQPSFINRGQGYRTASTIVTVTGDGFAEIIPEDNIIVLTSIVTPPGPGSRLQFATIPDADTDDPDDLKGYTAVIITDLGDDGTGAGTRKVQIQISPRLKVSDNLEHNTDVTIRERFAQCRISGHDFLDIGTGNFEQTNYPDLYAGGAFFTAAPENEVLEADGGRVFYTSTDQDGNFRAGELFSVEQATGIVTISAEFFDLDGLSELSLGGVRLGGSGTVINEFSTDTTFGADSNAIVPTQRAIATFLATRLSEGGSELETNNLVAGLVSIGTVENKIETTTGVTVDFPRRTDFSGDKMFIQGRLVAEQYMFREGNDTIL